MISYCLANDFYDYKNFFWYDKRSNHIRLDGNIQNGIHASASTAMLTLLIELNVYNGSLPSDFELSKAIIIANHRISFYQDFI